jgi:hypothetical protein
MQELMCLHSQIKVGSAAMGTKLVVCRSLLLLLVVLSGFMRSSRLVVRAAEEQALIVTITLHSGDMGNAQERKHILTLEDQLSNAIEESGTGEFDGDEFGGGVCTIYIYGPSADRLFSVARPILKRFRPPAGSYVIKRYGKPGSKQDRVGIDREEIPPQK